MWRQRYLLAIETKNAKPATDKNTDGVVVCLRAMCVNEGAPLVPPTQRLLHGYIGHAPESDAVALVVSQQKLERLGCCQRMHGLNEEVRAGKEKSMNGRN